MQQKNRFSGEHAPLNIIGKWTYALDVTYLFIICSLLFTAPHSANLPSLGMV